MKRRCLIGRMEKVEQEAIRAVVAGDRDAYRVLMDRHYSAVFRVCFRITGHEADAEEAAQESFLRAYNKLPEFRGDAAFGTWVTRIAMNTAMNLVERRNRDVTQYAPRVAEEMGDGEVQVASLRAGPERQLLDMEAANLRRAAMASLTPMERTAFTLRHMEDVGMTEIASALGVPVNSAKQAVFRAVGKLRRALAPVAGGVR